MSTTRRSLRQRIADQLGDYLPLEATSASLSTSTFIDSLNISDATDTLTGRMLYVTSGANEGHTARITNTTGSTSTINFTPAADNLFAEGDTAEVVNERGRGWAISEYNRAIDAAISDAYPLALVESAQSVAGTFDADEPVVSVPAALTHVYAVEWQDSNGDWWPLPRDRWKGWKVDSANETIVVRDQSARLADGKTIRVLGYKPYSALSADSDTTELNPEWIVAAACARLCRQAVDRDSNRGSLVLLYQQDMDKYRVRIRTMHKPHTEHVRDL